MSKKLIELYDKYELEIPDRFVAGYMVEYIDSLSVDTQLAVMKSTVADITGFRQLLKECIKYCKEKPSGEIGEETIKVKDISVHALFGYSQIKIMEEYLEFSFDRVEGICGMLREYFEMN